EKFAKLRATAQRPALISQSGIAVTEGGSYSASASLRGEGRVRVQVSLQTQAPDGSVIALATTEAWEPSARFTRFSAKMRPRGTSDRVSFVLRATGDGTAWVDQVSMTPDDNRQGWRTDVTDAIKTSRPSLIRWGGSVVDPGAYRWKNGIGD